MSIRFRTPIFFIVLLGAVTTLAGCVADQMGLLVGGGAGVMFLNNYVEDWEHDPSDYRTPGVKPKTAPETVSTVSIWETGFIVNWTPVSGTVAYNVYLNRVLYYEAQFETEAIFAGLTEGQTYAVEIAAVNTAGEGPLSSPIVVIPAAGTGNNVPVTTLTAPTGGETWSGNRNITWNASDQDGDALTITIEISSDSGSTWTTISSQEANDEIYTWDTTVIADGSTYRIRVSATDSVSLASDSSASDFSISNGGASHAPVISLTAPDGGENWSGTQDITWAASDPEGDTLVIDIYYSTNSGSVWILEAAGSPNDGSYTFDTTLLADGTAYRVRLVVSDGNLTGEDSSSSDFTIDNLGGGGETGDVVTFADPNLEAKIRETISKPTGDIYESDLTVVTDMRIMDPVSSLSGLEYCVNLENLDILSGSISDLSPLAQLSSMTGLLILDNAVSDISFLSSLTGLTVLGLEGNQIDDISPLAELTSLVALGLARNQISDISTVANLTNLTELLLDDNQISDIGAVTNLTNLNDLTLLKNQISDISAVVNLTNLTHLFVSENQISDISALEALTSLSNLNLSDNQITDIEPLVNNTSIDDGDLVTLTGNPLDATSQDTHIPALEARGVFVVN